VNKDKAEEMVDFIICILNQQLTNGWIPCSDRLPGEGIKGITHDYEMYNVSLKFDYGECVRTYKFGNGLWWNEGTDMTKYVIAWQPLPPKYEEDTIESTHPKSI